MLTTPAIIMVVSTLQPFRVKFPIIYIYVFMDHCRKLSYSVLIFIFVQNETIFLPSKFSMVRIFPTLRSLC